MPIVVVDDLDDARLSDYRHLREPNVRARVERGAGIFTVEGWLSLEALAESPYPVRSALVATKHAARAQAIVDPAVPVYAIAESARGQGYGAESLACACDWIASTFSVSRVLAITAVENIPSRRILEHVSFAHVQNEDMRFQGVRRAVSRYCWTAPTQRSGA